MVRNWSAESWQLAYIIIIWPDFFGGPEKTNHPDSIEQTNKGLLQYIID